MPAQAIEIRFDRTRNLRRACRAVLIENVCHLIQPVHVSSSHTESPLAANSLRTLRLTHSLAGPHTRALPRVNDVRAPGRESSARQRRNLEALPGFDLVWI